MGVRESEGLIVAKNSGNAGGERRSLSQLEAESERVGPDWQMKLPTTEQEAAELSLREAMLPPKVQQLRQKLSRKAKEQKRFRFYSL